MKKYIITLLLSIPFLLFAQKDYEEYKVNRDKMSTMLQLIKYAYVDTVTLDKFVEKAIIEMLKELDPHSAYISVDEVQRINEPLIGNFEGVGIQFQIIKDTIVVASVINGGPSEKVGIMPGDKFLKVDTSEAVGKHVDNKWVFDNLRGPKGTEVRLSILRKGSPEPLSFKIIRDKIPINSIDAYFMAAPEVGYIKLDRFSQTTMEEFKTAANELKIKGMKHLVLDLRGNSGGYLNVAIQLSDEFLKKDKLIVYTEGAFSPKATSYSTSKGNMTDGRLLILIDESSASASEIVSGAVQDWDRGVIMGRRSYGKGLVQKPYMLPDSSMVRLTISRYYTPTGRSIQKPYDDGFDEYFKDLYKRAEHKELYTADSIKFPDSLKYYTPAKRLVYGGGGIMPDIFVPADTNRVSPYYSRLFRNGIFNQYVMDILDKERDELIKKYPDFERFKNEFVVDKTMLQDFRDFAQKEGVVDSIEFNFYAEMKSFLEDNKDTLNKIYEDLNLLDEKYMEEHASKMFLNHIKERVEEYEKVSNNFNVEKYISYQIKFLLARNLFDYKSGIQIWYEIDNVYKQAIETIQDEKLYKKMKVQHK
jgi:carboxyl-terminal processing protease